jgi:hypothetical protein
LGTEVTSNQTSYIKVFVEQQNIPSITTVGANLPRITASNLSSAPVVLEVETGRVNNAAADTATLQSPTEINFTDMGMVHEETHLASAVVQAKVHRAHHEQITPVIDRQTEQLQAN